MKKIKKKRGKRSKSEIWSLIKRIWGITKKVLGVIFIIIGIIGLFLPVLQGILLILIGYALLKNKRIGECVKFWVDTIKKMKKGEKITLKEIFRS
jgi:hypothetical protein